MNGLACHGYRGGFFWSASHYTPSVCIEYMTLESEYWITFTTLEGLWRRINKHAL